MPAFVNLKVHSIYSILEGTLSIDRIIELAIEKGQKAVCLTDNNLYGSLEFSTKCVEMNIKPIIGCKLLLNHNNTLLLNNCHLSITVLVCSEIGYKNLLELTNNAESDNGYYIIDIEEMKQFSKGLLCLTGETGGLAWELHNKLDIKDAINGLNIIKNIFGKSLCIELQRGTFANPKYEEFLTSYAKDNDLIVVATNETYFESPNDYEIYEVLQTISKKKIEHVSNCNYFKSYSDMLMRYQDMANILDNTSVISNMCEFCLKKREVCLPAFLLNKKLENKMLYIRSIEALEYIFFTIGKLDKSIYYKRLIRELEIIVATNYSGYFLIVSDFVLWAKENDVYVGPGRGSAAGSLVAYCLGITKIDPIMYELLFERFLNINRISLPDIDIDFCHSRREKIVRYIQSKYGVKNVGQIITFGSLQIKAAMKDVGRYLNMPYDTINLLCKSVPFYDQNAINIYDALEKTKLVPPHLLARIMDITIKLIGLYRHVATHAAGLVISNFPLHENVPAIWDEEGKIQIVQYSMNWVESAGLPKFDLLGLKTLTAIDQILEQLSLNRININLNVYNDEKTFKLICEGKVLGTFQLEGKGMSKHIKSMQPSNLNDLAALIALYRPGPMKHIKQYSDTKIGIADRIDLHQAVNHILDETYGIVIYQEQVMLIAQKLAGYTLSEADILRRAMAKKDMHEMLIQKKRFVEGSALNGIKSYTAIEIFNTLSRFADYGFNKSHAIAYSTLAYFTSYLKANFPLEFYAVNMSIEINEFERISALYYDAINMNIKFISPNVCMPINTFKVGNGLIYFPLNAIKGIGEPIANNIINIMGRKPFTSLYNFCLRMDDKIITKKIIKSLILSGALDCFKISRFRMLSLINEILTCIKTKQSNIILALKHSAHDLTLPLLYEEYLILGCYVSKCPVCLIALANNLDPNEIGIVVSQNGYLVSLVTIDNRIEAMINIMSKLSLGRAYKYSIKEINDKLYFDDLKLLNI